MTATLDYIFDGPMVSDEDDRFLDLLERSAHELTRQGPNEDDAEITAPYIGVLPEESQGEEPSPLNFGYRGSWSSRAIDAQITEAMRMGVFDNKRWRGAPPTFTYGEADPNIMFYPFDSDGQND